MSANAELRTLFKTMRRIARAVEMHSRRLDRELGLTLSQHAALAAARDLGEVTGRALAEAADVSPATMVGILDRLESKGLIERYRSTRDRRIVHTRITAGGEATLARAPALLGSRFETGFMRLEPEERARAIAAVERIAELTAAPEAPAARSPREAGRGMR